MLPAKGYPPKVTRQRLPAKSYPPNQWPAEDARPSSVASTREQKAEKAKVQGVKPPRV